MLETSQNAELESGKADFGLFQANLINNIELRFSGARNQPKRRIGVRKS